MSSNVTYGLHCMWSDWEVSVSADDKYYVSSRHEHCGRYWKPKWREKSNHSPCPRGTWNSIWNIRHPSNHLETKVKSLSWMKVGGSWELRKRWFGFGKGIRLRPPWGNGLVHSCVKEDHQMRGEYSRSWEQMIWRNENGWGGGSGVSEENTVRQGWNGWWWVRAEPFWTFLAMVKNAVFIPRILDVHQENSEAERWNDRIVSFEKML